ncbi:MAG: class I SAM-dependent methyltransferase [Sulfurimonas sp.]|nr:class I SAM-dependent methyltransferase [Sulfurimonas sp.]
MDQESLYHEGVRVEILDFVPKKYAKVLEIGCGRGGFRNNLSSDCEYWGIEPYEKVANTAIEKLDKVLVGTFDEVFDEIPNDYFDLIICNDVIEHMVDHHSFYKKIRTKCTEDAYMIGSIPNVRYVMNLFELLIQKNWQYKEEGILDKTHLRFFTLQSIHHDFKVFNFKIEELHGINKMIFTKRTLSGWMMNIFQKILGSDTKYLQFGFRVKL